MRITTGSTLAVGPGMPIGVPVRLMGVNTASGTEATFASYAESGVVRRRVRIEHEHQRRQSTRTRSRPRAPTPRPTSRWRTTPTSSAQFAVGDWPSPDFVDQAIEVATTLYIMSNGVVQHQPLLGGHDDQRRPRTPGHKVNENGKSSPPRPTCWGTSTRPPGPCSTSTARTR